MAWSFLERRFVLGHMKKECGPHILECKLGQGCLVAWEVQSYCCCQSMACAIISLITPPPLVVKLCPIFLFSQFDLGLFHFMCLPRPTYLLFFGLQHQSQGMAQAQLSSCFWPGLLKGYHLTQAYAFSWYGPGLSFQEFVQPPHLFWSQSIIMEILAHLSFGLGIFGVTFRPAHTTLFTLGLFSLSIFAGTLLPLGLGFIVVIVRSRNTSLLCFGPGIFGVMFKSGVLPLLAWASSGSIFGLATFIIWFPFLCVCVFSV